MYRGLLILGKTTWNGGLEGLDPDHVTLAGSFLSWGRGAAFSDERWQAMDSKRCCSTFASLLWKVLISSLILARALSRSMSQEDVWVAEVFVAIRSSSVRHKCPNLGDRILDQWGLCPDFGHLCRPVTRPINFSDRTKIWSSYPRSRRRGWHPGVGIAWVARTRKKDTHATSAGTLFSQRVFSLVWMVFSCLYRFCLDSPKHGGSNT